MGAAAMTKPALRRHYRPLREQRDDAAICAAVASLISDIGDQGHLGLYWPLQGEPDLRPLLDGLGERPVALPCSEGHQGRLTYRPWDRGPLQTDGCGIPAPIDQPALAPEQLQLLLVPALAVDASGIRLGYGGGYYDRLRAEPAWRRVPALVVVPQSCISARPLPRDPWDQPFDGWVSEQGVQWCTAPRSFTGC